MHRAEVIAELEDLRDRALNEARIMDDTLALLRAGTPAELPGATARHNADLFHATHLGGPGPAMDGPRARNVSMASDYDLYRAGCSDRSVTPVTVATFEHFWIAGIRGHWSAERMHAELIQAERGRDAQQAPAAS